MQILVNFQIFKRSSNLSLTHLRAQSACYELKQQRLWHFSKVNCFRVYRKGLFSLLFFKEMYGISQENLYVDTGTLRHNVLELVDAFLVIITKSRIT